jgi:hypothetical protein
MAKFDREFTAWVAAEPDPEWRATFARQLPVARAKTRSIVEAKAAALEAEHRRAAGQLQ